MRTYVYGKSQDTRDLFEDYLDPAKTAIVSIDMHRGHLDPSPQCPCPAPRAREIVAPIDAFHDSARALGIPIIHVRSVLRRGGEDDIHGISSAWRRTFPLYVGDIPNSDAHAIEGSPWTEFVTRVAPDDLDRRDEEASVGILSDRPRFSPAQHARRMRSCSMAASPIAASSMPRSMPVIIITA